MPKWSIYPNDCQKRAEHGIHFVQGFLKHLEGIDWATKTPMGIRDNRYTVEVPTVTGPVSRPEPVHLDGVRFIR